MLKTTNSFTLAYMMIDGSKVWFAGLAKVALFNGHLGRGD